jgi:hypothetical protein
MNKDPVEAAGLLVAPLPLKVLPKSIKLKSILLNIHFNKFLIVAKITMDALEVGCTKD